MIHKLLVALDKNQLRRLVLVLAGTLVAGMLEMMGIGAIPVRNCTFTRCQFQTIGITGNETLLKMLIEQVTTSG